MKLHTIAFLSLGLLSAACSGFSGDDDASAKFSSGAPTVTTPTDTPPAGDTPNTEDANPTCGNGETLSLDLPEEIKACLDGGNLYHFNKWHAEGQVHKEEYCIKDVTSFECSVDAIATKAQNILGRDMRAAIQGKYDDGFLPISCATIGEDRVIYQLIKLDSGNSCAAAPNAGVSSTCYRDYSNDDYKNKDHAQIVNECLEDAPDQTR